MLPVALGDEKNVSPISSRIQVVWNGLVSHRNSSKQKIMKSASSAKKKKNKIVDAVLWDEKVCIFVNFVPRETTLNFSCYVAGLGVRRYSTLVASRLVG